MALMPLGLPPMLSNRMLFEKPVLFMKRFGYDDTHGCRGSDFILYIELATIIHLRPPNLSSGTIYKYRKIDNIVNYVYVPVRTMSVVVWFLPLF